MDNQQTFESNKCCIIIPTYNNATTIGRVIESVLAYSDKVIVINDGSTDSTQTILEGFDNITILNHPENRGKGYSLRKSFDYAVEQGYDYALTLDSDGQHLAEDIPVFLEALANSPDTLLIGARNMQVDNVPLKSSVGKKFSNFWIKVTTGLVLADTQSGFRLYPIRKMKGIKFVSTRFEFEVEVIVKSVWNDIAIKSVPVQVFYAPVEERISHYRPFVDFMRISMLNVMLVTLALFTFWPRKAIRVYRRKGFKKLVLDEIFQSTDSNLKVASALGFGIFMGIVPIWGYQLIVGFTLAHLMKLNKAIFFIAANISLPPLIPLILFASFYVGGWLLGTNETLIFGLSDMTLENSLTYLKQYLIGSIVLAILSGTVMFTISYLTLSLVQKAKN